MKLEHVEEPAPAVPDVRVPVVGAAVVGGKQALPVVGRGEPEAVGLPQPLDPFATRGLAAREEAVAPVGHEQKPAGAHDPLPLQQPGVLAALVQVSQHRYRVQDIEGRLRHGERGLVRRPEELAGQVPPAPFDRRPSDVAPVDFAVQVSRHQARDPATSASEVDDRRLPGSRKMALDQAGEELPHPVAAFDEGRDGGRARNHLNEPVWRDGDSVLVGRREGLVVRVRELAHLEALVDHLDAEHVAALPTEQVQGFR